ncbi:MAG: ABC transporter substrate-binding protein [Betaproteobacteria bacterium]|nr:ABC transporter substrate-binding protein [Betaproteobacteria bacterium]
MLFRTSFLATIAMFLATPVAAAADPNKVLRWEFQTAETGFDPALVSDNYSNTVIEGILEPLLTYDYLARPAKLVPLTVAAMPEVSEGGKTFVFKLKKGIHFSPDPVFKGKKRELVAEDYAYSIKRLMDPKLRAQMRFIVDNKIVGLNELAVQAEKTGKFDYDAKIPGLEVVDRHTLRIRLIQPDYNFLYILAMPTVGAVAREVIEHYHEDTQAHPVGTGPYMLKQWVRGSKIVLVANPEYRGLVWDFKPGDDPEDKAIVAAMKGKKMPTIGTMEIYVMEEEQSRWLAFQRGELDVLRFPGTFAPIALPGDKLAPDLVKKGITMSRIIEPEITYTAFNMQDPIIGGLEKEKVALRRALTMAYSNADEIRIIRKNQAIEAQSPIPQGVVGHNPKYRSSIPNDPQLANSLLDKFGYKKGKDGYRNLPSGKPFTIKLTTETNAVSREFDELWKKAFESVAIRMEVDKGKFSDHYRAAKQCQLQMWGQAWIADYPDGENFMQLLYGPNVGASNNACYKSPAFDKLYEQARSMPNSPERDRLFEQMSRQIEADTPWRLGVSRYRTQLVQPQVKGYKKHPMIRAEWLYIDIEPRR